jgi:hypothetical protein
MNEGININQSLQMHSHSHSIEKNSAPLLRNKAPSEDHTQIVFLSKNDVQKG